nr:putative ribonuclease H-like domain-containing protein [Tanacetum cinerariifolium]
MDQQNPTLAKIPILDTGKFEQWQFRIQQYLQHEHYALWEVIKFGDSYVVPASAETTDTRSDGTSKKKGRTVTLTVDDMQRRKNDVKARTTLLSSLPDEHQLRFSKYKTAQKLWAAILKTFGGNEATKKTKKNLLKQAPRSQDRGRRDNYRQGSKVEEQAPKALMAIDRVGWDWSYMANDEENHALVAEKEAPTEFALMANTSTERLAQVESRLVEHKEREIKYCEKIRGLELDVEFKTNSLECLIKKLETLKKEKEGLDGKLAGFQTASKDLDSLFESQRLDKNKEGLGYSVVPPPPAQLYSSSKKDLSWTGLPEFKDDIMTDYSRPAPTIESSPDDAQNRNSSVTKEASSSTISPNSFIKFVKANDSPTKSKIDKSEKAKKSSVKKFPTGGLKFHTTNMGKKEKAGSSQNNFYDKGYWDSGCSRHMTGNISYLSYFEPFDGGYVSFGQGGCKITGKGTIKTDKLEFENVYFVKDLKCDNGGEFRNKEMNDFCSQKGIKREFSNAMTPQQNGVAERRNMTLIEVARTMLADAKLPVTFWAEAVNTACYVQNRVLVNKSQTRLHMSYSMRVQRLKKQLKARTPIQKVNRGRS